MFKPEVIAFDVETENPNGSSLEYWHPDFRVISAAFSWFDAEGRIKNRYLEGEDAINRQLKIIESQGIPLVAHNAQFENGVMWCRFPEVDRSILKYDTMRLTQCYDSGGRDAAPIPFSMSIEDELAALQGKSHVKTGLGLESAASRILPKEWHGHKKKYYQWLRENKGVKKGEEGKHLHLLPPNLLAAYNTSDTDVTLLLFSEITKHFKRIKYDFTLDHTLHFNAIQRICDFKIRGVKVDREGIKESIKTVKMQMKTIVDDFRFYHQTTIEAIEQDRINALLAGYKSEHGKQAAVLKIANNDSSIMKRIKFNPKSTTQLKELFVDRLGIKPQFFTSESKDSKKKRDVDPTLKPFTPKPSFRAAHLDSYGEGGKILKTLKKRQIVLKQLENLLALTEYDGRWHIDLKACGTKTGRYSAGVAV